MARKFRIWNFNAGAGYEYNVYLADLAINGLPLDSTPYSAERTLYRKYGPHYYATFTTNHNVMGLTFPLTEIGLKYDVYYKTNLTRGTWQPMGYNASGNGQPLHIYVTNSLERLYLRTAAQPVN